MPDKKRENTPKSTVAEGVEMAMDWINDWALEFPRVDPHEVRRIFADQLRDGTAAVAESEIERIYRELAELHQRDDAGH